MKMSVYQLCSNLDIYKTISLVHDFEKKENWLAWKIKYVLKTLL